MKYKTTEMLKELITAIINMHGNPYDRRTDILVVGSDLHHAKDLQHSFNTVASEIEPVVLEIYEKQNNLHIRYSGFSVYFKGNSSKAYGMSKSLSRFLIGKHDMLLFADHRSGLNTKEVLLDF